MTHEAPQSGLAPPLPAWAYWCCMALAAGIPVLLMARVVPIPWDAILAAVNAALAVLTGTSRPAGQAERQAAAAKRKSLQPPPERDA